MAELTIELICANNIDSFFVNFPPTLLKAKQAAATA